jgi:hypothetical protein
MLNVATPESLAVSKSERGQATANEASVLAASVELVVVIFLRMLGLGRGVNADMRYLC